MLGDLKIIISKFKIHKEFYGGINLQKLQDVIETEQLLKDKSKKKTKYHFCCTATACKV